MLSRETPPFELGLVLRPLIVVSMLFAIWVAILAIPGAWFLAIICLLDFGVLATMIVAGIVTAVMTVLFWRYHWVSGVTMLAAFIALPLLCCEPTIASSASKWVADVAQLIYYRPVLLRRAEQLRENGLSPSVAAVTVDGFGSATFGLALDPTGEILLPPEKRSKAWTATAEHTELGVDNLAARHIIGDYYSWFYDYLRVPASPLSGEA